MRYSPNFHHHELRNCKGKSKNYALLKKVAGKVLKGITQKYLEMLHGSIPKRLHAVVDNPKSLTKY